MFCSCFKYNYLIFSPCRANNWITTACRSQEVIKNEVNDENKRKVLNYRTGELAETQPRASRELATNFVLTASVRNNKSAKLSYR